MNRIMLAAIAVLLAVALGVAVLGLQVRQFLHAEMAIPEDSVVFDIPVGSAFSTVSRDLAERGYIEHPDWYRWYARLTDREY